MRKFVLLFSLLILVLSACRIESNVVFDINDDGSAEVGLEIGIDDEFLDLMASQAGGSVDDFLDEMLADLGGIGGADVETRTEGDMNYYGTSMSVADLSTSRLGVLWRGKRIPGFLLRSWRHQQVQGDTWSRNW